MIRLDLSKGNLAICPSNHVVKDQGVFVKYGLSENSNNLVGYIDKSNESDLDRIKWLFRDAWKSVKDNSCMGAKTWHDVSSRPLWVVILD